MYARAYLEGRLTEDDLDHFRMEIGRVGLSSYPHPRLMPDFWEYPTVSMGLGPINAIYHARFNRYLQNRRLDDTSGTRVWCFIGDGETDEPETLGALTLASRERLDNLIFVVNCNLQRLDGPVRGNGKIIQELEASFRGAGWNVIKVIWGSKWDELLATDIDGVLLNKMNTTVDGEFQRYSVESGAYIREHFFGPDPRLRKMVDHLSDDELRWLPRGGHDYRKLYAAYKAATENLGSGRPTVILAKTIKGWTLGPEIEGRNATHQIKKMTGKQLQVLRDRLYLHEEIPDEAFDGDEPPYYRPPPDSVEYQYMMERRHALDGPLPRRVVRNTPPARAARRDRSTTRCCRGRATSRLAPPWPSPACCGTCAATSTVGARVVPIIPDEARTFGMDALFRELKIYAAQGQKLRARRPRPAAVVHRGPGRPDPRGGHHRERVDRQLHRRRPPATPTGACRWSPSTSSIRCSASSGSATSSGRPPTPGPEASCWAPPPGAPRCSARACSTRTATASCWPPPCPCARPTTRPSPTRWRRS